MSPTLTIKFSGWQCVPRASGDEPDVTPVENPEGMCSPRERG